MAKARIMVVDDESILRMDIREMLEEAGYEVVAEAANGEAAIELAHVHRPDLIIMDVKMSKMNGVKAGRIIFNKLQIPILLLTAYSDGALIEAAKEAGIVAYLVKPVSEADLIPAIEIALAQGSRLMQLSSNIRRLEQQLETRKLVERAKGILMERYLLPEQRAYELLRKESMDRRIPMERLAREVIGTGRLPGVRRAVESTAP
ncbi:MAG: response regulator [Alicyclobacillaceae bacterium]|nr:response regulator [Alicyclobacillaceae bacterium]